MSDSRLHSSIFDCMRTLAAVGGLLATLQAPSAGQTFVSVDLTNKRLVAIDASTGIVTAIGPLGTTFYSVHMASFQGQLYAHTSKGPFNEGRLNRIDPVSGAILETWSTDLPGTGNVTGESLFSVQGQLLMSADPGQDTDSEIVALIAANGSLTPVADFSNAYDNDMDGLVEDPSTGLIYNLDHDSDTFGATDLYRVILTPPSQTLIKHYDAPGLKAYDPVIIGSAMYALGISPPRLVVLDLATGAVQNEIAIQTSAKLAGLERLPIPIGTNYCFSTLNSTGFAASISGIGSASASTGNLTLLSGPVPNQVGLFFHGGDPTQVPFGNGNLCISSNIVRGAVVLPSGSTASYTYDSSDFEHDLALFVGSTRYFQHWFRDTAGGGALFNTSDAMAILVQP